MQDARSLSLSHSFSLSLVPPSYPLYLSLFVSLSPPSIFPLLFTRSFLSFFLCLSLSFPFFRSLSLSFSTPRESWCPLSLSLSFLPLFLSLALLLYTQRESWCRTLMSLLRVNLLYVRVCARAHTHTYMRRPRLIWIYWSVTAISFAFSLSFSLSLSHTHAHCRLPRTRKQGYVCLSPSRIHTLSFTHAHNRGCQRPTHRDGCMGDSTCRECCAGSPLPPPSSPSPPLLSLPPVSTSLRVLYHTHTHMHSQTYTNQTQTYTNLHKHKHTHKYTHTYTHSNIHAHKHTHTQAHTHTSARFWYPIPHSIHVHTFQVVTVFVPPGWFPPV